MYQIVYVQPINRYFYLFLLFSDMHQVKKYQVKKHQVKMFEFEWAPRTCWAYLWVHRWWRTDEFYSMKEDI
jgi:hypothetical protein